MTTRHRQNPTTAQTSFSAWKTSQTGPSFHNLDDISTPLDTKDNSVKYKRKSRGAAARARTRQKSYDSLGGSSTVATGRAPLRKYSASSNYSDTSSARSLSSKQRHMRRQQQFMSGHYSLTSKSQLTQDMSIEDFLFLPSLSEITDKICQRELELQQEEQLRMEKQEAARIQHHLEQNRHQRRHHTIRKAALLNDKSLPKFCSADMKPGLARSGKAIRRRQPQQQDEFEYFSENRSHNTEASITTAPSSIEDFEEVAFSHQQTQQDSIQSHTPSSSSSSEESSLQSEGEESSPFEEDMDKIPLRAKQRIQSLNLLSQLPSHLKEEISRELLEVSQNDASADITYTDLLNVSSRKRKLYMKQLENRQRTVSDPLQKRISRHMRRMKDEVHPTKVSRRPAQLKKLYSTSNRMPTDVFDGREREARRKHQQAASTHSQNYRQSRAMRYHSKDSFNGALEGSETTSTPVSGRRRSSSYSILKAYLSGNYSALQETFEHAALRQQKKSRKRPKLILDRSLKEESRAAPFHPSDPKLDVRKFEELRYGDKTLQSVSQRVRSKIEAHRRVERRNKRHNYQRMHFGEIS